MKKHIRISIKLWIDRTSQGVSPLLQTIIIGVVLMIVLAAVSWQHYRNELLIEILAELHGIVLDIFVIGILIVYINGVAERRKDIEQATQMIDDLRNEGGQYAKMMILSSVKLLARYGVTRMNLNRVKLPNARLSKVCLLDADLNGLECTGTVLSGAKMINCTMNGSRFDGADLCDADLSFSTANGATFDDAFLSKAQLVGCKLITASFRNCNLSGASFCGSNLLGADFQDAHLLNVNFRDVKELTVQQLAKARLIQNCYFDENLRAAVESAV